MTDIEQLFLAAYPLWPMQLINKFSSLLSYEVARFNPEINAGIVSTYKDIETSAKIKIAPYIENVGYLLAPSKQSRISQVYFGKEYIKTNWARPYNSGINILGPDLTETRPYMGKVYYDTRIYKSVSITISVEYQDNGPPYSYSYLSIMSYSSEFIQPVLANVYAVASVVLNEYSGASTVLAMIENGIQVDVNKNLLQEFVTFLNAYGKYSDQLSASNSLQAEKQKQNIAEYKNSIHDKLTARKNELMDLKTQINFAAKNETASAKRDMQNLALNAQSLIMQLQGSLK